MRRMWCQRKGGNKLSTALYQQMITKNKQSLMTIDCSWTNNGCESNVHLHVWS